MPNTTTDHSIVCPAWRLIGSCVSAMPTSNAPKVGPERRMPSSAGADMQNVLGEDRQ